MGYVIMATYTLIIPSLCSCHDYHFALFPGILHHVNFCVILMFQRELDLSITGLITATVPGVPVMLPTVFFGCHKHTKILCSVLNS